MLTNAHTASIDSLDRTNAAHFLVGRTALGRQLYSLGIVPEPQLAFTDSVVEMLMEMYEIVGNRVALQVSDCACARRWGGRV